jgi:hypothetical protein
MPNNESVNHPTFIGLLQKESHLLYLKFVGVLFITLILRLQSDEVYIVLPLGFKVKEGAWAKLKASTDLSHFIQGAATEILGRENIFLYNASGKPTGKDTKMRIPDIMIECLMSKFLEHFCECDL